jgi:hypothetical protein
MTVKIGHARYDENNKAKGGKPGDQTGKEILVQNWYSNNWTHVFRAKDKKVAEKIALAMEQTCVNNNIGYNQGKRTTLFESASKSGWDISKIKNKCECDCSSLVSVCVNAAGIAVSKDMYTGNQKAVLSATNKFYILTAEKYLVKQNFLLRGDILLCKGHTAIVLYTSTENIKLDKAQSYNKYLSGVYKVTADKLNVRAGSGTHKDIIITIPKGTQVNCYGYYSMIDNIAWLYIQFTYNNKKYTGFASSKYLTK